MSPRRRRLALFLAAAATAGLTVAGVALWHCTRPEVQRAWVTDALTRAGWSGRIAAVSLSPDGVFRAEDIDLTDPQHRRWRVAAISGELALWETLFGDTRIRSLDVSGLTVDTAAATDRPAGGTAPHAASPGFTLPKLRIDRADLGGTHTIAGTPAKLSLRIRDFDTRSGGSLIFGIDPAKGPGLTGEARLRYAANATVYTGARDFLDRAAPVLAIDAECRARAGGRPLATLVLRADNTGGTLAATSGASKLAAKLVFGADGAPVLTGESEVRSGDLAPPVLGTTTPDFTARAAFKVSASPGLAAFRASLTASAIKTTPAPGSPDTLALEADLSGEPGGRVAIGRLTVSVGDAAGGALAAADISGLTYAPATGLHAGDAGTAQARLRCRAVPAVWLNAVTGDRAIFEAGTIGGETVLTLDGTDAAGTPRGAPLHLTGIAFRRPGTPALTGIDATLPLRLAVTSRGDIGAALDGATVTLAGAPLATGSASWRSDPAGDRFGIDARLFPGALPSGFLPGGVVEFCTRTGAAFTLVAEAARTPAGDITVRSATLEAVAKNGTKALAVTLPRPLPLATPPADGRPLALLSFKGAPLGLFNPWLGGAVLAGTAERGDLDVSLNADGWRVARSGGGEPATIRGLAWTDARGTVRLRPTDAEGTPVWQGLKDGWRLSLTGVRFTNAKGAALTGALAFDWKDGPSAIDADFGGELLALNESLPDAVASGITSGAFTVKIARARADGASSAEIGIRNLKTAGAAGTATVDLRGTAKPDGGIVRIDAPLVFSGPSGVTRASLAGDFTPGKDGRRWRLKLAGDTLYADDWLAFAARPEPAAPAAAGGTPSPAPAPRPDTVPFWAGETGTFDIGFDTVRVAGEVLEKPKLALEAEAAVLRTVACETVWRGVPVTGRAALAFKSGSAAPYALTAAAGAARVDLGRLVTAFSPRAKGMIEGAFDIAATASGEAPTAPALAKAVRTDLRLTGSGGVLRFFKADNEVVRLSGDIVGIAGDIAGDIGRVIGKKVPVAGKALSSLSLLRSVLGSIGYDTLTLTATRLPDGAFRPAAVEIVNDTLRLRASGGIGPDTGGGFGTRIAAITGSIEGKGPVGTALGALGAGGAKDGDWTAGPPLRFDGPLNNVGADMLNNLFRSASPFGSSAPEGSDRPAPVIDDAVKTLEKAVNGLGF